MDQSAARLPFDVTTIGDKLEDDLHEIFKPKPDPNALLGEREVTHGSFEDNARISQTIKEHIRQSPGWDKLTFVEREAMDMIALKFSRVLSGKSLEKQHWEDVVGYAQLALNQCA